ncbi:MAG: hypothetical protein VB858_14840, partial [Planctomycetaceae bacterium]
MNLNLQTLNGTGDAMRMTLTVMMVLLCCEGWLEAGPQTAPAGIVREWTFEEGKNGWKEVTQVSLTAEKGLLTVRGTGPDPHFMTDVDGPAGWKLLRMYVRCTHKLDGQVFWATDGSGGYSEARSVRFQTGSTEAEFRRIDVFFRADK